MAKAQQGILFEEAFDPQVVEGSRRIDPQALQEAYLRVPEDLGYFCGVYANALEMFLKAKRKREDTEVDLKKEYRAEAEKASKKVTETYLDECVAADPRYRKVRDDADAADIIKERVKGIITAIEAKRDMLVSFGADVRAERRPPPSLNERERGAGLR